ncbi:MAG TPA: SDR family NAD(P)-dependent oxidoreductase [Dehalococcoidia bacterium]|nr:SDR family NAD(P)-dependent oxidoreductase [Dehalococcoidia bacterium]
MDDFEGKVAVVTGGASGIGFAMASRFAQEGMKVVLGDVEEPALEAAVAKLRQQEYDVLGVLTDVAKPESVEHLAQETLDRYGKVHILCNNAGVGGSGASSLWEATLKDWHWAMGVNLWGVIHGVHTFVPIMLAQDEPGHVVNTASMAGLAQGNRVYSVTKHAVVALSEALHDGLRTQNTQVYASVLCPGLTNTQLMFGARNRPDDLRNYPNEGMTPEALERSQQSKRNTEEHGMPPERTAEIVLQAIKDRQFYILTHEDYDDVIRERMDNILARRNPDPKGPGLTSTRPRA